MQLFRKISKYIFPAVVLLAVFIIFSPDINAASKKKFMVVIDAGHGGNDHGAIENGVNEKDVNLAVALKLGEMISKKLKDTEVVYTRSTDEFISLQKRAEIANKAHADLFVSVHCNSVDKKNKNRANVVGATTYILGHHKDADNLAVAQRENAVAELDANDAAHYKEFDPTKDDSQIIYNITQRMNIQNSRRFATDVQKEMASAGRFSRGVQQAGFWVLWSTAMPAALVELDFICNPEQAKFLSSKEGQEKLANAIFNAVKSYETYYRKSLGNNDYTESSYGELAVNTTSQDTHSAEETVAVIATEVAELPKSTAKSRTASSKPAKSTTGAGSDPSSHRRRPKGDRVNGTVTEAIIDDVKESQGVTVAIQQEKGVTPVKKETTAAPSKTSPKEHKTKERVGQDKPARRDSKSKGKATRQNVHIVYRILVYTSSEELKSNDKVFQGLSPISSFRENNMYKYTYGESTDRGEMEAMLPQVRELFPEAFVIRIIN